MNFREFAFCRFDKKKGRGEKRLCILDKLFATTTLYGHFNQLGIVVHETEGAWKVSIQKFDGHYMCILKTDQCLETLENVSPSETLSLVANFHDKWYAQHKGLYQSILLSNL